jgi:hypothetical protein
VKKMSGSKRAGGRQFGEGSYTGKGLMTGYSRPSGGSSGMMKIKGRKASSNSIKNFKGRATKTTTRGAGLTIGMGK